MIIAVGGGSVIDMAKLIIFFKNKKHPYTDHFTSNLKSAVQKSDYIFICVGTPTLKNGRAANLTFVFIKLP